MIQRFVLIMASVLISCTACEKEGKLHPNLVPLGYPTITSFDPQSAMPGTIVHIAGDNLSDLPAIINLWIGELPAEVKSHTMHDLYFTVPNCVITTTANISLEINYKKTLSGSAFTILTPWSAKTRFPGYADELFETFVLKNAGYVIEPAYSDERVPRNALWVFDPNGDNWSRKADLPGGLRYFHTDFTIGNKAYAGLGYGQNGYFSDFWRYDPDGDSWDKIADYPGETKINAISFQTGGKGYISGGQNYSYQNSMELWEYDPLLNLWTRKRDLSFQVQSAVELSGLAYITDFEGNVYNYIPDQDAFQKVTTNPYASRFQLLAFHGFIYFLSDSPVPGLSVYDCSIKDWKIFYGPFPMTYNEDNLNFSTESMGFCIDRYNGGKMYGFTPEYLQ